MGLLKTWGIGAEFTFKSGRAQLEIKDTRGKIDQLRASLRTLKDGVGQAAAGLGKLGMVLAPIGLAFGGAAVHGSALAADLEASKLTMRVMIGDAKKAEQLMGMIRENAASTPFSEGDLIEGSKRLLRLSGDNISKNMEMLELMETMAALNPTKSVVDGVEALLDAASGGGFERLKEFGISLRAEDFAAAGRPGGEAWADAVVQSLQDRMTEATRGEDLVKALGETFTGRKAQFLDGFSAIFRGMGEAVNAAIGPLLAPVTDVLKAFAPHARSAMDALLSPLRAAQPVLTAIANRLAGWLQAGSPAVQLLTRLAMGVGLVLAVAVPVVGAIGAVVFAVSGLVTVVGAAWPILTGLFGVISTVGIPAVTAFAVTAGKVMAALTAGGGLTAWLGGGALLSTVGSALLALGRILWSAWDAVTTLGGAWIEGIWLGLQPTVQLVQGQLRPAFRGLLGAVSQVFDSLFGGRVEAYEFAAAFRVLGTWVGWLVSTGLEPLVAAGTLVVTTMAAIVGVLGPVFKHIQRVGTAIVGLITGTFSFREAATLVWASFQATVLRAFRAIVSGAMSNVEHVLRFMASALGRLPGVGSRIKAAVMGAANAVRTGRLGMEAGLDRQIRRVEAGATALERRRSERAQARVDVHTGDTVVQTGDTVVQLDGREVARSAGREAVRDGERGKGPRVTAGRRGRVLRGNVVGALQPLEVVGV